MLKQPLRISTLSLKRILGKYCQGFQSKNSAEIDKQNHKTMPRRNNLSSGRYSKFIQTIHPSKKRDVTKPENDRPISILQHFRNALKKLLLKLIPYLGKNKHNF